jgi:hypothetical protein
MDDPLRDAALDAVERIAVGLVQAQDEVDGAREALGEACRSAHEQGISDRELANLTPYSRARIQQFRTQQRVAV